MSKNAARINKGIRSLTSKENEIVSGTVVSVNADEATMSVQVTGYDDALEGVMLNAVSTNANGLILFPAAGSDVIIGSVDGPGEYTLIRSSNIDKAIVTIGATKLTIDANGYSITHHGESLTSILTDLCSKLEAMTFTNGGGTTPPANNVGDIIAIKGRINNLLT